MYMTAGEECQWIAPVSGKAISGDVTVEFLIYHYQETSTFDIKVTRYKTLSDFNLCWILSHAPKK